MAGSTSGGLKLRARAASVSVELLLEHERRNEFWCSACRIFHPRSAFHDDRSRSDGRARACAASRNEKARQRYEPRPPTKLGGTWKKEARDGDKKQARGRINYLVRCGVIPAPNELPCVDCGHRAVEGERHEYDHYLGYGAENHETVEAVCTLCHRRRMGVRKEIVQVRDSLGRYVAKEVTLKGG